MNFQNLLYGIKTEAESAMQVWHKSMRRIHYGVIRFGSRGNIDVLRMLSRPR